ncbi:MAG: sulfatase [Planctomycetota bacterium]|nr:sulfatase [Planctomycetota bacterium]
MRLGIVLLAVLSASCGTPPQDPPTDRGPNLLLLVSDDQGVVLGCYGADSVQTPRLDAIAQVGRRFTRAYAPSAVCTPSRSSIYTGLMPARHGASGFGPIADGIPVWGELLGEAGYRTGLIGKVGAKPLRRFPFDFLSRSGRADEGARSLQWHVDQLDAFLEQDDARPWALVVNFRDSHWPFPTDGAPYGEGSPPPHDPARVDVPGALVDTPAVRAELARFHDGLRRMDATVGAMLDRLAQEDEAEDLIGFFTSDNGPPFPFAKTTLYEAGIHMPLVAFGGGVEPGVDDHLISLTDLLPTFLDLAGAERRPSAFDGRSLAPLLEGGDPAGWRTSVFGTHDAHRVEPAVPSRSVRFDDWKYIRTWSEGLRFENGVMLTSDTWPEMVGRAAEGDADLSQRVQRLQFRPAEELYDLSRDPQELVNLAGDPGTAEALAEARRLLAETDLVSDPGR